jgi:disulfide bond formation protein DsbB
MLIPEFGNAESNWSMASSNARSDTPLVIPIEQRYWRSPVRMMYDYLAFARKDPPLTAAAAIAIVGALGLATVYIFQYVFLILPCPLCLEQRIAFYFSIPLAAMLWLGAQYGASRKVLLLGFLAIMLAMLWNTGLSAYHAGVEWKWWPGPLDCSGPINKFGNAQDIMSQLQNRISLIRCDEAAWRFLGISLAGYDVLLSFFLAGVATWGALAALAQQKRSS